MKPEGYTMVTDADHAEGRVTMEHAAAGQLPPHTLRRFEPGDHSYVIDTWLQTYRPHWLRAYGGPGYQRQLESVYWSRFGHVGLVESILDDPQTSITVACLPDSPAFIYGWICCRPLHLHYVFVRDEFRGLGFGRRLLRAPGFEHSGRHEYKGTPMQITHMTPDFSKRLARDRQVRFVNPYRKADR